MAKVRPIIPDQRPDTPEDRAPDRGNPKPGERNDVYKEIGRVIIAEWRDAVANGRALNRDHLETAIANHLRLDDPNGTVEFGLIVDPRPDQGRKFVWIVIPYPDAPPTEDEASWVEVYANSDELTTQLGEAVLFGCGR